MGVQAGCIAAEARGLEELTVRGRGCAGTKICGERLALLLVDQAPQCHEVGFFADVPVSRPSELAEAGDAAGLGHAGQAEIEPIGQQSRHQDATIG